MVALSITTLMGFMALAVDVGILFHVRREVQIVADAAAVAASSTFRYNASQVSATTAAKAVAPLRCDMMMRRIPWFDREFQVTFPPGSRFNSPRATGSVQAVVNVPIPTFFMKLFQINR